MSDSYPSEKPTAHAGPPAGARSERSAEAKTPEKPGSAAGSQPAPDLELPDGALILVPLRNLVIFPGVVTPISLGRRPSVEAVQEAVRREVAVGFLLQKDAAEETPGAEDLYRVGTSASVLRFVTAPDGTHHTVCMGQQRFRILEYLRQKPFPVARVDLITEQEEVSGAEIEARMLSLRDLASQALELLPQHQPEVTESMQGITSPSLLADLVTSYMDLPAAEKQEILEEFDLGKRLEKVTGKLGKRVEILKLSREINRRTRGKMDQAEREYYLREQLRTIQKELGEEDAKSLEIGEFSDKIAGSGMPEEVEKEARRELARLERLPEAAAEYSMVRTYLEWLVELPWSKSSGGTIDMERARRVLDEDHFDLEKVKKRILEFLAVRKLKPDGKSPILCLAGPPGVGKTSLGQSVARAMNREFVRISLGGCHDEAEIRGHRRTYIGSLPGNIIQGIRRAGTRDPVFMLDEIDKVSPSAHGDPASALLEVLDPEQNSKFRDNYLGVPFDLSRVIFIATANFLEAIPGPLRDRCEVLRLSGYTEEEKREIARRYLVGRQLEANGLGEKAITISDEALSVVIREYTREAGCRNLEREIASILRSVATRVAAGDEVPDEITVEDVRRILGTAKYQSEVALRTSLPGVATGMSWTPVGGEILFVEATHMPGKGELILTGQLGNVMKESGRAAISLAKSHAADLGIPDESFSNRDVHIHVPAGAIPKDGPSAGVTLYVAVVSLLTGRKVRSDIAMTGEVSLRGLVLPVGGIKEKVLAAVSSGIRTVMLPSRNRKDFEDIPESAREKLEFVWIETVREALEAALEPGAESSAEPGRISGESPAPKG